MNWNVGWFIYINIETKFFFFVFVFCRSLSRTFIFFFLPSNDVWKAEVSRLEGRGEEGKEGRFSKLKQKQGTKKKLGILFLY